MFWMLDLKINSSLISIVYCRLRSCIFKVMFVWEKHKCLSNDETVYVWDNDTRLTYLVKRGGWIQVTMTRQFTDLIMVWTSSIYNRVWTIFTRYIKIEKNKLVRCSSELASWILSFDEIWILYLFCLWS